MKRKIMVYTLGVSTFALIFRAAPASAHVSEKAAQKLSRKELKQLIRNPSSPEAYEKLARHFDQKAQSLDLKAQEHDKRADYDASVPGIQPKVPYPGGWISHCRFLASQYEFEAQKARAKAQHYRALSQGSANSVQYLGTVA